VLGQSLTGGDRVLLHCLRKSAASIAARYRAELISNHLLKTSEAFKRHFGSFRDEVFQQAVFMAGFHTDEEMTPLVRSGCWGIAVEAFNEHVPDEHPLRIFRLYVNSSGYSSEESCILSAVGKEELEALHAGKTIILDN
jgi:hypothetical protein